MSIKPYNDKEIVIEFRYTATYGGVGSIRIEGNIIFQGDVKELSKKWLEDGNLPDNIASEIHTGIMRICVPEAVMISRDLKLPPPIPLPNINFNRKKKENTRVGGMEVA